MKKTIVMAAAVAFLSGAAFAAHTDAAPAAAKGRTVTDTKTTYDVSSTNKKGTTSYGGMRHTQTTPEHGTRLISQSSYSGNTPSLMARANDKKAELSLGLGGTYSYAKDDYGARLSNTGLAGSLQMLWHLNPHFALGADYTMLAPQSRDNAARGGSYQYRDLRAHSLALAGKWTVNAWDRLNLYVPMGLGATHVGLKGSGVRDGAYSSDSDGKWGLGLFAGLGLQYNLTDTVFMGLEYRYHLAFVKSDDLNRFGKDKNLDFHSAMLRVGMRF